MPISEYNQKNAIYNKMTPFYNNPVGKKYEVRQHQILAKDVGDVRLLVCCWWKYKQVFQ